MTGRTPDETGRRPGVRTHRGADYTEHLVIARKDHYCDDYPACHEGIKAGEPYLRSVAFPGHDAVSGNRPWVMKLCCRSSTFARRMADREAS